MIKPTRGVAASFSIILMAALLFINWSCDNDDRSLSKSKVKFTVGALPEVSSGRLQEDAKPGSVIITILNDQGKVHEQISLNLIAFGNGYVSEDLELAVGHYRLSDFFVMSEEGDLMYVTPKEGSPLAQFVNDPLDIEFDVSDNQNNVVAPQVLAVDDMSRPGDFGYANFGFDIVKLTAFILPGVTEKVVKVSYKLNDLQTSESFEGEAVTSNRVVDLNNPMLLNRSWNATIMIWTESNGCEVGWTTYEKVYRLTTQVMFNGAVLQLPDITDKQWEPLYNKTLENIEFFFSADPLRDYFVEVHVPKELEAGYFWLDRVYWSMDGLNCDHGDEAWAELNMNGKKVGRLTLKDQPNCETPALNFVDSFAVISTNAGDYYEYFSWTMKDGKLVPTCDLQVSSSSRIATKPKRDPIWK